ncbi:cell division protein CrgA [Bifidobacterium choloepi]|uniref:Cell division protein CrgA n=1 Tax=Bifidobacterium choloepi TaxID=2614131 RepID=A0A6I5NPF2_9BIFI|nr:cell division protein CrgA [Bifidobacterium choloepi]NEG70592.1 cell division protein CrgA [Bifidobacterium choloepi]
MADEELHEAAGDKDMQSATADQDTATATATTTVTEDVTEDVVADADDAADADGVTETEETEVVEEGDAAADAEDTVTDDEDNDDDIPMDKVEAVLNAAINKKDMTPQMRRMMARQSENTKRVEESIKGTKANPGWFVPLFCALMIIGLVWAVVFYLTYDYPIPGIHQWNLLIAFAFIMVGFIMTMWWR